MNRKRIPAFCLGLVHRVMYATLFAGVTWYSCGYPRAFGDHEWLQNALCYGLNYPIAVVGRATTPYRGIDVFFDTGGEWCDFCSAQQVLWYHVRFAVPIYVAIFYLPALISWLLRRRKRLRNSEVVRLRSPDTT